MDQSLPGRFWSKVDRNGPDDADHMDTRCWNGLGGKDQSGTGSSIGKVEQWALIGRAFYWLTAVNQRLCAINAITQAACALSIFMQVMTRASRHHAATALQEQCANHTSAVAAPEELVAAVRFLQKRLAGGFLCVTTLDRVEIQAWGFQ